MAAIPPIPPIPYLSQIPQAIPGASGAAAAVPGAQSPLAQLLQGGIRMPKIALTILTIFTPTGMIGLNQQAVGNTLGAILKVVSYGFGILWGLLFNNMYPSALGRFVSVLMFLGPWYIFDILNILFNPTFNEDGFEPPIPIQGLQKTPMSEDGTWLLTPTLMGLIVAVLPAGAYGLTSILKYYFPGMDVADAQKYMGYATLGAGTLLGGLSIFNAVRTPAAPAMAGTSPSSSTAPPIQQLGGGGLPPLSQFVKGIQKAASPEAFNESLSFLGILGIVIVSGIVLGLTRKGSTV